jgi:hypothetical protein
MYPQVLMMICVMSSTQNGICQNNVGIIAVQVTEPQCRTAMKDERIQGMCIAPNGYVILEKRGHPYGAVLK